MRGSEGIVPVMDINGSNNNGFGGFGGDGWAWIIVLFLIFGWGNNGFGNNGSNGSVMDAYVLNSDFATLQRLNESGFDRIGTAINQVNNGLCNGFYTQAQLINGVQSQLAACCCDIREGISGVNYNLAMNTNVLQNAMCNNTRDIVDTINANYRSLHDEITANRIEDKNAQIAAQQNEINALRLAASQEKQNAYLVDKLNPNVCPVPAYLTCNPNTSIPVQYVAANGCGCGNYI